MKGDTFGKHRFKEPQNHVEHVPALLLRTFQERVELSNGELARLIGVGKKRVYLARMPKGLRGSKPLDKRKLLVAAEAIDRVDLVRELWADRATYRSAEIAQSF